MLLGLAGPPSTHGSCELAQSIPPPAAEGTGRGRGAAALRPASWHRALRTRRWLRAGTRLARRRGLGRAASVEGARRGLGSPEQPGHCTPDPRSSPAAWPCAGLCCCLVLGCCQAVGRRPEDRAPWPYMVREREEGLLLAQEGPGGYRAPCTALIAPSAPELLQLLCWISADKKGALDRAGIQLADGCRTPAWCY